MSAFRLAKSEFAATLDVSTAGAPFKSASVASLDRYNRTFIFPPECLFGLVKY